MTERSSLLLPERVMWEKAAVFYNVLGIWPTILLISLGCCESRRSSTMLPHACICVRCRRLHQSAGYQEGWVILPGHLQGWTTQWSVWGRGGREMCFMEGRGELESMMKQSLGIEPSPAQIILRQAVLSSRFLALNLTAEHIWLKSSRSADSSQASAGLACAQLIVKKMILLQCP